MFFLYMIVAGYYQFLYPLPPLRELSGSKKFFFFFGGGGVIMYWLLYQISESGKDRGIES